MVIGSDTSEYAINLKRDIKSKLELSNKIIFTGKQENVRKFLQKYGL